MTLVCFHPCPQDSNLNFLYQTPGVHVQGGSSKQFNSHSDISLGNGLSKVYIGRTERGRGGGRGGAATK